MYTSVWVRVTPLSAAWIRLSVGRVGGHGYGPMTPQKGSTALVHSPGRH